jgi:hypothetical protein
MLKNRIRNTAVALAGSGLMLTAAAPMVSAAPNENAAGAAGVVAAVVALQNNGQIDVTVVKIDRSLNNLLQNSRFLNNNTIEIIDDVNVENFLNDNTILQDFLNNNNILVQDVVEIRVLSGGDFLVLTQ